MFELNEHTRWILGQPNFVCGRLAPLLRKMGFEIEKKSEDEQATCIHYFLTMWEQHGDNWKEEVQKAFEKISEKEPDNPPRPGEKDD